MWIAQSALDKYECDGQPLELMHPVNGVPTRCSTCVRINEAVRELNNLVVRNPYLATDGMAGAPPKFDWETEAATDNKSCEEDSEDGSHGDGMSKQERQEFLDKVVQSFVNTAGKGLTEQEVYGDVGSEESGKSRAEAQRDETREGRGEKRKAQS